jgi:hypothetical protein
MVFQKTVAGSADVNVVYGPEDLIKPLIIHWGEEKTVSLTVQVKLPDDTVIREMTYNGIELPAGRESVLLEPFSPGTEEDGHYVIEYILTNSRTGSRL